MSRDDIDRILDKLVREVESAVHALYRGELRQVTARARTEQLQHEARTALAETLAADEASGTPSPAHAAPMAVSPRPSVAAPMHAGAAYGWTSEDSDAVLKCIMSWLPVGAPSSTPLDSRCIAPRKLLIPTWAERERAREAVRRISAD